MELFDPTTTKAAKILLSKARKHNAELSAIDSESGNACPENSRLDIHLRTAISALVAGIQTKSWDCVAQGLCMLQDAELRLREGDWGVS